MMIANWMLGASHHLLGDQASARRHCETALKPELIQNSSLIRSGNDQRIRALVVLARALWLEGNASPSKRKVSGPPIVPTPSTTTTTAHLNPQADPTPSYSPQTAPAPR